MSPALKVVLIAVVAGFAGAWFATHYGASASAGGSGPTLRAHDIQLVDSGGKVRALLTVANDEEPVLFFFDREGRNRMNLGLYPVAEGQYPFVVLNDTQAHAAGIFRLFGGHESPVVVLKNGGNDRSVYGLNPDTLDPFLVNVGRDGRHNAVFGNW